KGGFVPPAEDGRDAAGQAPQHLALRVDDEPLPLDLALLGHRRRHQRPLDGSKWASKQKNSQRSSLRENRVSVNASPSTRASCRATDRAPLPGRRDTGAPARSRSGARASSRDASRASTPSSAGPGPAERGSRRG